MLEHGGNLLAAATRYGIPPHDWLDLSTGINPLGWPVPEIPAAIWRRLPEETDGLIDAAAAYYGTPHLHAVAGSQAAIQLLPALRAISRVGILAPGYGEHAHAWTRHAHHVIGLDEQEIDAALNTLDVLVLCNPNNPTASCIPPVTLLDWRQRLAAHGGWLVVDEAFADAEPASSIVSHAGEAGLVVLRSVGKFFGLAGIRLGFVAAWPVLLEQMQEQLGPWSINGPARWIARHALQDGAWQSATRQRLKRDSMRLSALLAQNKLSPACSTALFQWVRTGHAAALHDALARQGILTRLFTTPSSLRFGLPGTEAEWERLTLALEHL